MVERICPTCQHGNPMENRFCGACGASLERNELARRDQDAIVIAGQSIPLAQVRQVGKAVAISLAALAAEAGVAYLKRRAERVGVPTTALAARPADAAATAHAAEQATKVVTIVSQRVVEVWEHGGLARQIVERHVWRKDEG
jgi:glutamate racemase